jgi:hypothetical protein
MSLEVQQQPRGRQPPDHAQLPQRTDGAARKVRHDARALLRRDRADTRQRVHHQHDRRQHAVAPVRVGRLRHGQTLVDRRAEIGVADARVRVRVVKCRERRKERAETRLRTCKRSNLAPCVQTIVMQLQALRGQHDVRHAHQQRQRVQRAGDTRVALLLEFGRRGSRRADQRSDRPACARRGCAHRRRPAVSLAHIDVQNDVLASDASARIRRRPADDGAPEPASSTESIIEYVLASDAAMAARAQRRACGSLPSFGETRRGIRRHGDARLGAAKRVERDAKLHQQYRPCATRIALSTASELSTCCRTRCDAQFASDIGTRIDSDDRTRRTFESTASPCNTHCTDNRQQWRQTTRAHIVATSRRSSILDCSTISEVLDRTHQVPLAVER